MIRGSVITDQGTCDITLYYCCMNTQTGVYYYKTYEDSRLRRIDMYQRDLEEKRLITVTG